MQRRDFLRAGLLLGTAGGLLSATGKVSEAVNDSRTVHNTVRNFYTIEKFPLGKRCTRTSYKCQNDPPEGTPPIWAAAVREDWNTLKRCLDEDPSLISVTGNIHFAGNICFYKDLPLIHVVATWSDSGRALQYLVSLGADVNTYHRNSKGRFLLSSGANINSYHRGGTPLHFAVRWSSNVDAIRYLISEGANVNAKDTHGRTPLHWAAGCNPNVEVAKCLVENGAEIRAKDDKDCTPLTVSFHCAKSDEVGLYFLDLMMGQKGVEVTDPIRLAEIQRRFAGT